MGGEVRPPHGRGGSNKLETKHAETLSHRLYRSTSFEIDVQGGDHSVVRRDRIYNTMALWQIQVENDRGMDSR